MISSPAMMFLSLPPYISNFGFSLLEVHKVAVRKVYLLRMPRALCCSFFASVHSPVHETFRTLGTWFDDWGIAFSAAAIHFIVYFIDAHFSQKKCVPVWHSPETGGSLQDELASGVVWRRSWVMWVVFWWLLVKDHFRTKIPALPT